MADVKWTKPALPATTSILAIVYLLTPFAKILTFTQDGAPVATKVLNLIILVNVTWKMWPVELGNTKSITSAMMSIPFAELSIKPQELVPPAILATFDKDPIASSKELPTAPIGSTPMERFAEISPYCARSSIPTYDPAISASKGIVCNIPQLQLQNV